MPIRIEVDTKAHALASISQQIRSLAGFGWRGRSEAAAWALRNGVALDEALG